ncbi:MAG: DNA repair and recombination protein RadB [Methermicoccaceae archaeon]
MEESHVATTIPKLRSGCEPLDSLLGGGFERGVVSQVYGGAGSGKTNVCLQTMMNTVLDGYGVMYIDTEGFSMERLSQMAKEQLSRVASSVSMYEPLDFSEQGDVIRQVERAASEMGDKLSLIIFDSATSFYRLCTDEYSEIERRRELAVQLSILHRLARTHSLAVLITNQVYTDVATGNLCPIGGVAIEHISKAVLKLERLDGPGRRAVIKKHRSRPEGEFCEFTITGDGLV